MNDEANNLTATSSQTEIIMPRRSRYAGQAVDTSSRRSIAIKSTTNGGQIIGDQDSHCTIEYFYHDGEFWRAVIPLDGVEQVFGQAFNFSKAKTKPGKDGPQIVLNKDGLPQRTVRCLNHVQSRFRMRPHQPIELYVLGDEPLGKPAHQIHDMIYSLEAVGPPGVMFNLRDGLAGNLLSAHRFLSTQEMVFERIVVENQHVSESPPLPLKDSEKRATLIGSLIRSHHAGMTEPYYLYRLWGTNNCTSSPLQLLDKVVKYRWNYRVGSFLYRLPMNPRLYLRLRGMDSDPEFRKLVRNEFAEYIDNAETRQRKRDYVRRQIRARRAARSSRKD